MNGSIHLIKRITLIALVLWLFAGLINTTNVYARETRNYLYVTTANLRLRTGPSLDDTIIRTVPEGTTIRVYDRRCGEWFSVSDNGTTGYMYAEFLSPVQAEIIEYITQEEIIEYVTQAEIIEYITQEEIIEYTTQTYPEDLNVTEYIQVCIDYTDENICTEPPYEPVINIYGVELVEWSVARDNIIRRGAPLHITDVRTGTTFWLESFSNGSHADVVPRTRADTEALRSVFGGRWTWEPRAILVTVDGRTFAASMSGMPHGSFNRLDNGIVGHFCMHFPGSRTHNGNRRHENDHQNRVREAFDSARW